LDQEQQSIYEYPQTEARYKWKEENLDSKIAELRTELDDAEKELAETKRLRNQARVSYQTSLVRLRDAETEFVEAGVAYTKENMKKFGVVHDKEDEHSDKEVENSECDHTDDGSTGSSVADPDTDAEPQEPKKK
jgi:hypothetical protein